MLGEAKLPKAYRSRVLEKQKVMRKLWKNVTHKSLVYVLGID